MRYLILLIFLVGCTTTAHREGNFMVLKGYGAKEASWEKDGEKYSISRDKAIPIPDIIPTR